MRFSIVTPTLNRLPYLKQAADSILSQGVPLEWLVIDGGSTDGTVDWLTRRARRDDRIRFTTGSDAGQADAINRGLTMATGEIVGWLNADDCYLPRALSTVAAQFDAKPAAQWLIGDYKIINDAGQTIRGSIVRYKRRKLRRATDIRRALLRENLVPQMSVFWRRAFGQPLDSSLHYAMDYDLWLRLAAAAQPVLIAQPLAQFRLHATSKSGRVDRRQFDEQYAVVRRHLKPGDGAARWVHRLHVEKTVWAYRLMRPLGL